MASSCNLAKLALAISLVSGLSPVHVVLAASAQEAVAQFNVPAGSLDQTLLAIGQQTGRTISFDPALAKAYRVPAVTGLLSTEQAIAQALRSTDLRLGITSNGTLTVERAPQAAAAPSRCGASGDQ